MSERSRKYAFLPNDWEERTVPFSKEIAELLPRHPRVPDPPVVFPSSKSHVNFRFMPERCKDIATRPGLDRRSLGSAQQASLCEGSSTSVIFLWFLIA